MAAPRRRRLAGLGVRAPPRRRRTSTVLSPIDACRHVDDPLEADAVGVAAQDAQVGEGVLDLAPGVEPGPADELVADAVAQERFLDRPRLGVHPVHDRDVLGAEALVALVVVGAPGQGRAAAADQALDLAGDPLGLLFLVVRLEALDLRPAGDLGPELLVLARGVARHDGVGGVEDELGRAVVALELDDRRRRPVPLEVEDVAQVRAPPRVDRLVVVPDDARGCRASRPAPGPTGIAPGSCPGTRRRAGSASAPGTWPAPGGASSNRRTASSSRSSKSSASARLSRSW